LGLGIHDHLHNGEAGDAAHGRNIRPGHHFRLR
jgi:hypothetical protein